jgi:hypothetical protein
MSWTPREHRRNFKNLIDQGVLQGEYEKNSDSYVVYFDLRVLGELLEKSTG